MKKAIKLIITFTLMTTIMFSSTNCCYYSQKNIIIDFLNLIQNKTLFFIIFNMLFSLLRKANISNICIFASISKCDFKAYSFSTTS